MVHKKKEVTYKEVIEKSAEYLKRRYGVPKPETRMIFGIGQHKGENIALRKVLGYSSKA